MRYVKTRLVIVSIGLIFIIVSGMVSIYLPDIGSLLFLSGLAFFVFSIQDSGLIHPLFKEELTEVIEAKKTVETNKRKYPPFWHLVPSLLMGVACFNCLVGSEFLHALGALALGLLASTPYALELGLYEEEKA